jgi:hypothetical protein
MRPFHHYPSWAMKEEEMASARYDLGLAELARRTCNAPTS